LENAAAEGAGSVSAG